MTPTIMPPTQEVLALCDSVDELIAGYLTALPTKRLELGRFESEVEAYTLQKLVIRHAEAVILMARHDMVCLPPAHVVARAAFETHIKIMWMLKPVDPFEQECRWIVHLRSAVEHHTKLAKSDLLDEAARTQRLGVARQIDEFAAEVAKLLEQQGYKILGKAATVWDMLKELDLKPLYAAYIQLSAYTHSNFEAASLYRKHLGTSKELGEFITAAEWAFPIEAVWKSLYATSRRILELVEASEGAFDRVGLVERFEKRLAALRNAESEGT